MPAAFLLFVELLLRRIFSRKSFRNLEEFRVYLYRVTPLDVKAAPIPQVELNPQTRLSSNDFHGACAGRNFYCFFPLKNLKVFGTNSTATISPATFDFSFAAGRYVMTDKFSLIFKPQPNSESTSAGSNETRIRVSSELLRSCKT